jgi:hypothetical protein
MSGPIPAVADPVPKSPANSGGAQAVAQKPPNYGVAHVDANPAQAAAPAVDPQAVAQLEMLSKPQNKAGRKGLRSSQVIELFRRAGIEITRQESYNWLASGRTTPPGVFVPLAPGQKAFEPVRNHQIIDQWNAELAAKYGDAERVAPGDVTTSGDGMQFGGGAAAKPAELKLDPMQEKAVSAMKAYDLVDTRQMNINTLFSAKPTDIARVDALIAKGAYVKNDGSQSPPLGATYVMAKTTKMFDGRILHQFLGTGVIIDKTEETVTAGGKDEKVQRWTTMSQTSLSTPRTNTALRKIQFTPRVYDEANRRFAGPSKDVVIMGWFVPEQLPQIGGGKEPIVLRDAYDQQNNVEASPLDSAAQAKGASELVMLGHNWMGADWHGGEDYGYALVNVPDLDAAGNEQPVLDGKGKPLMRKGKPVIKTKEVRKRVSKAVSEGGKKAQALAYKIYAGNPDKIRNPDDGSEGSPFTTCIATASKILSEYGIDVSIFGGLIAPVYQDPKKESQPRHTALFAYLKRTGAWLWGAPGFVPEQGDVFLTGSYSDAVNAKAKTHGLWTFQHTAIVAKLLRNDDGQTFTLLTQDGGKGLSRAGEDKTGYTIRNYDPNTRVLSGASPKLMIGVWRPAVLRAALLNMPDDIRATLKPGQLESLAWMKKKAAH